MPTLNKTYTLTITPEQFLEACSAIELQELDLLIQTPRYAHQIAQMQELEKKPPINNHLKITS